MKNNYDNLIASIAQLLEVDGSAMVNVMLIIACSLMATLNSPQWLAAGFGCAVTVRMRVSDERQVKRLRDEADCLKAQLDRLQRNELLPKPREGEERKDAQK